VTPARVILMARPTDPIPDDANLTRFQAQIKLGLFAAHDWVMLALILFSLLVIGAFAIIGELTWFKAAVLLLCAILFGLAWVIVLVYRCLVFILDAHADIQLMPEAAARIAAGYLEGREPKK